MTSAVPAEDLIIGITPCGEPDARLAAAVTRAGGLGVLDLGTGDRESRDALARLRHWAPGRYGVRVAAQCRTGPAELIGEGTSRTADGPHTVILGAGSPWRIADLATGFRVLVEVTDLEQALTAVRAGAHGLIARGGESGGRVGELSTFVLLQHLLSAPGVDLPVWACGGIGLHTAAAAVAGGAAGVVLDSQLALLAESFGREVVWKWRHRAAAAPEPRPTALRWGATLLPFWVHASPAQGALLTAVEDPTLNEGPHLSYAIQWFTFSTIAVIGYPLILRRNARQRRDEREADGIDQDEEPAN